MHIRYATVSDLAGIRSIWNDTIKHSTANWRHHPYSIYEILQWYQSHNHPTHPILVACEDDVVIGFASLSEFRANHGYWPTAEDSIYVDAAFRGRGVATTLMRELLNIAKQQGLRSVVAMITQDNVDSIHLHQMLGFRHVGNLESVGEKFGKPLTSTIWQLNF